MLRVRANDADNAVPFDNLTVCADRFYAGSYFHTVLPCNVSAIRKA